MNEIRERPNEARKSGEVGNQSHINTQIEETVTQSRTKTLDEDIIIFLDLETTGLSHTTESILEIGLVIYNDSTDSMIDQCNWVTRPIERDINDRTRYKVRSLDEAKAGVDPFVLQMHEDSGLWAELAETKDTLFHAGEQIPDWLAMNDLDIKNRLYTVAGNGPDRFDRPFLQHNAGAMNNLDSIFHYRSLDISNLFHALKKIDPSVVEGYQSSRKKMNHRGIDDCLQSIEDWRWLKESVGLNPWK